MGPGRHRPRAAGTLVRHGLPGYLEKTNATAVHAALQLGPEVGALDFGGALRSGAGALRTALTAGVSTLVVAADQRGGLATSADEPPVATAPQRCSSGTTPMVR